MKVSLRQGPGGVLKAKVRREWKVKDPGRSGAREEIQKQKDLWGAGVQVWRERNDDSMVLWHRGVWEKGREGRKTREEIVEVINEASE